MLVGAEVLVRFPDIGYVPMKIAVPEGEDVKRRIGTVARVMLLAYTEGTRRECLWCGDQPEEGRGWLIWAGRSNISQAPHGPYCSTSCWLSAS